MQVGSINKSPGEIKRREVSWTLTKSWSVIKFCGSRRDQEEGGGAGSSREPSRGDQEQGGGTGNWATRPFFGFSCSSTAVRAKRGGFDNFVS